MRDRGGNTIDAVLQKSDAKTIADVMLPVLDKDTLLCSDKKSVYIAFARQYHLMLKTIKYDDIYINDYQSVKDLREGIDRYMHFYNYNRFHSALAYRKPMNVYLEGVKKVA